MKESLKKIRGRRCTNKRAWTNISYRTSIIKARANRSVIIAMTLDTAVKTIYISRHWYWDTSWIHDFLNRRITDLGKRHVLLLLLVPDRSTCDCVERFTCRAYLLIQDNADYVKIFGFLLHEILRRYLRVNLKGLRVGYRVQLKEWKFEA